jgi:hypothetical protein
MLLPLSEIAWEQKLLLLSREETSSLSFFIYFDEARCFLEILHHADELSERRALSDSSLGPSTRRCNMK